MDCGKDYIKMCEKAEGIQGLKPKEGDDVRIDNFGSWWFGDGHTHTQPYEFEGERFIWLPRQDQLQEMCKEKRAYVLSGLFDNDMENFITGDPDNWSMEQLWLAFVMETLYQKRWDGTGWIKERR